MNRTNSIGLLTSLVVVAATVVFSFPRIAQNPACNHYADRRSWIGIPYTFDV